MKEIIEKLESKVKNCHNTNTIFDTRNYVLLDDVRKLIAAINYTHCCETSIADFQIDDKITFKQHRSGIVTDVYINELQVKGVNGNYKTIGKNDVIEKH